jgi:mono/diheme cytochrome c family protein
VRAFYTICGVLFTVCLLTLAVKQFNSRSRLPDIPIISRSAGESISPSPDASGPAANTLIARGKYLATAGNCVTCHSRGGAVPFSGGLPFETPFGTIYSSNITPDPEVGIGSWTSADFTRAMRYGVAPNGRHLFPVFPYIAFTKVADDDVTAIYAYLQTIRPSKYSPPSNGLFFDQRWAISVWNELYFTPGRFTADASKSSEWNRGAYLVEGLGHCGSCHTPRNFLMAEKSSHAFAGGRLRAGVSGEQIGTWSAANLTSARDGLAAWSVDDLVKYLSTGVSRRGGTFGPMNEVVMNSTMQLTREDVRAIAVYLKGLPNLEIAGDTPPAQAKPGEAVYTEHCESCHLASGRGGMFGGPPLAGSAVVQTEDPATLINVILYGPAVPSPVSLGGWETMKPYKDVLSNAEVASVSNYIRGTWSNRGRPISADDVRLQRFATDSVAVSGK